MKILFLHKQILFPRDSGGKIRVLNLLKHLAREHDVTYLCNLRPGEEQWLPAMRDLGLDLVTVPSSQPRKNSPAYYASVAANLLSPRPFWIDRNYDPAVRDKFVELTRQRDYELTICDTAQMARHMIGVAGPPAILFQHNVEAMILGRHAETARGPKRWFFADQQRKMRRFESECGPHFAAVVAVSEPDRATFEREYGWRHVSAIDTAVDDDYFRPSDAPPIPGRVMFLGSMDWMPNQEGVTWFVREVWPAVRSRHPNATLEIVGRNPPTAIRQLTESPGVSVTGSVPDVRPHLAAAAVVAVPILVGGGTRLKIFEAMASGRAVVSTTIGAEGLAVSPGEHYERADTPSEFAAAIIGLLADADRRDALAARALAVVRERFGSAAVARQFAEICQRVVSGTGMPA